jgi:hypothetical protein
MSEAPEARHRGLIPTAALILLSVVAGTFALRSNDLFWHLASGRWILDHRELPAADPFRFTSTGAPWIDHEWLFQVLLRLLELIGGIQGLVLARAAVVVGLAALLLRETRRSGASLPGAVLVTAAALLGARPRFLLRPELASLVGLVMLLALLQRARREGSRWPLALCPLLVAVWANLHPGVIIAPMMCALFLLGARLPGGSGAGRGGARRIPWLHAASASLLSLLAIGANPAGFELLALPLRIGAALRGLDAVNPEWTPSWSAPLPAFLAGAGALAILVALGAWRAGRLDPATGLVSLLLLALAISGVRHQGLFFLGAAYLAGETLADLRRAVSSRRAPEGRAELLAGGLCLVTALWCLWPPPSGPLRPRQGPFRPGFGIESGRFPAGAVYRLAGMAGVGPLYNDVAFGGYLLWRLYPPRQIFVDGRNEVNPELLREMVEARPDAGAWNAMLDRYGVDGALVRYDDRALPVVIPGEAPGARGRIEHHTASAVLFPRERYGLVHWDDVSMLFLRRTEQRRELLAREEYRFVQPEDRDATLSRAALDPGFRAGVMRELRRALAANPKCRRARDLWQELSPGTTDG